MRDIGMISVMGNTHTPSQQRADVLEDLDHTLETGIENDPAPALDREIQREDAPTKKNVEHVLGHDPVTENRHRSWFEQNTLCLKSRRLRRQDDLEVDPAREANRETEVNPAVIRENTVVLVQGRVSEPSTAGLH